jgi:hypothetical protein
MNANVAAKWFAAIMGAALVGAGLLGFVENPIVGEPQHDPIFHTGWVHNVVHIVTGVLALFIAFGLSGVMRANALIGFGVLYGAVLLATLFSPDLFGVFEHPVNPADHILHGVLAGASFGVGWGARCEARGGARGG